MTNDQILTYLVQVIDDFVQNSSKEDLLHNLQTVSKYLEDQNSL